MSIALSKPDARVPVRPMPSSRRAEWLEDNATFIVACLMLVAIVALYGTLQRGVFTLDELNLVTGASMTLILAATGQTIVLQRGGIDLSIGGVISLSTAIAATQFGQEPATIAAWSVAIVLLGIVVGALNGLLISVLRLQPFLVTLATWSVLNGCALLVLPVDGGSFPGWWMGIGYMQFGGLGFPVWLLVGLLVFWVWFSNTQTGISIRASGSNEKSAFLSGVPLLRINLATYALSGMFAALAALYLTTQIGAGSPTIGKDYVLPTVAAAVVGGVSLFGGRGNLLGTVIGAFILTLIGNLVFAFRISSYWQPVAAGIVLLVAVLTSSIANASAKARAK